MIALSLSIIMPVLNEAVNIVEALRPLAPLRGRGVEVVVVDGGSTDTTVALAQAYADRVLSAPQGRGVQMNTGARVARANILVFLHADTVLPTDADRLIVDALADPAQHWGRFDVRIAGSHPMLAVVARLMNLRSRITGIATGDQAIFVRRSAFDAVGGFPDLPLMEDIVLSRSLKRLAPPVCLAPRVTTSGRRWEKHGVFRTIFVMWQLRLAFWFGADPVELARRYGYRPQTE